MGMVPELPVAMLACARLGAPHTVVFGGFSADSLSDRLNDMGCEVLITQDEGLAARHDGAAEGERRRGARPTSPGVEHAVVLRRTGGDVGDATEGRDLWWHELVDGRATTPSRARASRWTPRTCSTCCTRAARPRSRRGSSHTTGGYLVGAATTHHYIFDVKPDSRVLVRGRHRLGHRPQLHRLRPALQRHDRRHVRGDARLPGQGPLVGDRRALQGRHPLHGADGDPHAHEVGPGVRREARPLARCGCSARSASRSTRRPGSGTASTSAATARPVVDTWWQTETGMILITPLPGVTTLKPGSATRPFPGVDAAVYDEQGNEVGPGRRRLPRAASGRGRRCCAGSTGDDARYRETYWSKYPGRLLRRRRRPDRRGRRLLAARPRRRRDERLRATGSRRSRSRARSSTTARSPRRRSAARDDAMTGQAIVAFVTLKGGEEGSVEKLEELRNHVAAEDRPDREAGEHRLHARAAEDAQRQDHAPPAARRGREPAARATRRRSPTRRSSRRSRTARTPRPARTSPGLEARRSGPRPRTGRSARD